MHVQPAKKAHIGRERRYHAASQGQRIPPNQPKIKCDGEMSKKLSLKSAFLIFGLVMFCAAYSQMPLFSSNQNTYYLNGLRQAGYGLIGNDWLANQPDSIPVFSQLIAATARMDLLWLSYVCFAALAMIYAASMYVLASRPRAASTSTVQTALFLAIFTFANCVWALRDLFDSVPGLDHFYLKLQQLLDAVTTGVALQYILGSYTGAFLQPSAFGVLLAASFAAFVSRKTYFAIVLAVAAGTIHPTYIFHAAILTAIYLGILLYERQMRTAAFGALLACVLVCPIVYYVANQLRAGDANLLHEAQRILATERIPYHALVKSWIGWGAVLKIVLIAGAVYISRRDRRLSWTLAISTILIATLSAIQYFTGSISLALIFPWRLSILMVPTALSIIVMAFCGWLAGPDARTTVQSRPKGIVLLATSSALLIFMGVSGARETVSNATRHETDAITRCLKKNASKEQVVLVPLDFESFRLSVGLPIFIDWKSHPYQPAAVLEWRRRIDLAGSFYSAQSVERLRANWENIQTTQTITQVVSQANNAGLMRAAGFEKITSNGTYSLYLPPRNAATLQANYSCEH